MKNCTEFAPLWMKSHILAQFVLYSTHPPLPFIDKLVQYILVPSHQRIFNEIQMFSTFFSNITYCIYSINEDDL